MYEPEDQFTNIKILQHMRSTGKENSMPYQIISRGMVTVINRHGLDIEALTSSQQPLTSGTQGRGCSVSQIAGSSQQTAVETDLRNNVTAEDAGKISSFSSKPMHIPSSLGHDIYQGSANQLTSMKSHGSNVGTSAAKLSEIAPPRLSIEKKVADFLTIDKEIQCFTLESDSPSASSSTEPMSTGTRSSPRHGLSFVQGLKDAKAEVLPLKPKVIRATNPIKRQRVETVDLDPVSFATSDAAMSGLENYMHICHKFLQKSINDLKKELEDSKATAAEAIKKWKAAESANFSLEKQLEEAQAMEKDFEARKNELMKNACEAALKGMLQMAEEAKKEGFQHSSWKPDEWRAALAEYDPTALVTAPNSPQEHTEDTPVIAASEEPEEPKAKWKKKGGKA